MCTQESFSVLFGISLSKEYVFLSNSSGTDLVMYAKGRMEVLKSHAFLVQVDWPQTCMLLDLSYKAVFLSYFCSRCQLYQLTFTLAWSLFIGHKAVTAKINRLPIISANITS